jgi:hypothetical protein
MKRFIMFAIVVLAMGSAVGAHSQWPFPQRTASRRRTTTEQEAPRPQLKRPDGTPVEYPQVQAPASFVIPAGTRVLMKLTSPLHTTSGENGSGVYVEVQQPVVVGNQVVIPQGSKVKGTVVGEKRPGRIKGRAQFHFRFEQLILPDNRVLAIDGKLLSLPGSARNRRVSGDGTVEPVDQIDHDVATLATGAGGGALGGLLINTRTAGTGAAIGGALALGKILFTRGDEINLPAGTDVEMVLEGDVSALSSAAKKPGSEVPTVAQNKRAQMRLSKFERP